MLEHCKDVSGQRHKLGDSYIGEDGCNTCRCLEKGNACTKRMCPSENDEEIAIGRDTAYKIATGLDYNQAHDTQGRELDQRPVVQHHASL